MQGRVVVEGRWEAVRGEMKVEEYLSPVDPEIFAVAEDMGLRLWLLAEYAAVSVSGACAEGTLILSPCQRRSQMCRGSDFVCLGCRRGWPRLVPHDPWRQLPILEGHLVGPGRNPCDRGSAKGRSSEPPG